MKKNNISYPHPVLGVNKGILPDLDSDNVVFVRTETESEYIYTFTLKQNNQQISTYINEGFAVYVCEVDCQKTMYKDKVESKDYTFEVKIPKIAVLGHIDFTCYVITKRIMPTYRNNNFNIDYKDPETNNIPSFYLENGSVLVAFDRLFDNVTLDYDKKISLTSYIQVIKGDDEVEHVEFDISHDIIDIILPKKQFEEFHLHNELACLGIFATSIISNALIYAILHIEEAEGKTWADSIKIRMETDKALANFNIYDPKEAVDIAFILLSNEKYGDPYDLLFSSINKLTE